MNRTILWLTGRYALSQKIEGKDNQIKRLDAHNQELKGVFERMKAVRLGQKRDENGKINWEYWVENEPLTVLAFLIVAENVGAFG